MVICTISYKRQSEFDFLVDDITYATSRYDLHQARQEPPVEAPYTLCFVDVPAYFISVPAADCQKKHQVQIQHFIHLHAISYQITLFRTKQIYHNSCIVY